MGVIRAFIKLAVVVVLIGVVGGLVALVSRGRTAGPVSYDAWPTVPRNPES